MASTSPKVLLTKTRAHEILSSVMDTQMTNTKYNVIETSTKQIVATCASLQAARRKADKFDLQYGAVNHSVKAVQEAA
jgi:hypothetical protein